MVRLAWLSIALLAAGTDAARSGQSSTVTEMLQTYSRGDSVVGLLTAHLRSTANRRRFPAEFKRLAGRVPAPIAAAFALEAASLASEEAPVDEIPVDTPLAILEVGCGRLRQATDHPTEFETHWQLLAADVITSSTGRRNGSAETFHWPTASVSGYDDHFGHVLGRHGSAPQLALRFARFQQAQFHLWRLTWGVADRAKKDSSRKRDGLQRLELSIARLALLLRLPDLADEARVRSGDALLYLGRDKEALELLRVKPAGDDWDYIRRLVRARLFMGRGDTADAAREYEAAIMIAPRSRPANLALAGLAYLAGQYDLAERLSKAARDASELDRWVAYMHPGRTDFQARVTALRAEARGAR